MDIKPKRVLFDASGLIQSCFWIVNNDESGEKVLIFKVRRSEQKSVDFSPKYGRLNPGQTIAIKVQYLSKETVSAKIAIKAMSVDASHATGKFDSAWDQCASQYTVLKEVIEVAHADETPETDDPYEETFDEVDMVNAFVAKISAPASTGIMPSSPQMGREAQKLFSELNVIDESVEKQYKTDPEKLTPRRIKKSIVSPPPRSLTTAEKLFPSTDEITDGEQIFMILTPRI